MPKIVWYWYILIYIDIALVQTTLLDISTWTLLLLSNDINASFALKLGPRKRQLHMFQKNPHRPWTEHNSGMRQYECGWLYVVAWLISVEKLWPLFALQALQLLSWWEGKSISTSCILKGCHHLTRDCGESCDIVSNKEVSPIYTKLGRALHLNVPTQDSVSMKTLALCKSSPETTFSTDFKENHLQVNWPSTGEALAAGLFHKGV